MDFCGVELPNSHTWRRLTTELADRSSPLSVYVGHRYPDTNPLESEYLASHPTQVLVEPVGDRRWRQELGNAWEFVVQSALWGRVSYSVQRKLEIEDSRLVSPIVEYLEHHAPQVDMELSPEQAGACWILGQSMRSGGTLVERLEGQLPRPESLLAAGTVGDRWSQLNQLHRAAKTSLYPELGGSSFGANPTTVGGSQYCPAEPDLIGRGTLVELKVESGSRHSGMTSLTRYGTAYQLLCYALFDLDDKWCIKRVGLHQARFGYFHTWDLADYLSILRGVAADPHEERALMGELLRSFASPSRSKVPLPSAAGPPRQRQWEPIATTAEPPFEEIVAAFFGPDQEEPIHEPAPTSSAVVDGEAPRKGRFSESLSFAHLSSHLSRRIVQMSRLGSSWTWNRWVLAAPLVLVLGWFMNEIWAPREPLGRPIVVGAVIAVILAGLGRGQVKRNYWMAQRGSAIAGTTLVLGLGMIAWAASGTVVDSLRSLDVIPPGPRSYQSCSQLRDDYPTGVALTPKAAKRTSNLGFRMAASGAIPRNVYKINGQLDHRDLGVACPRRR